VKQTKRNSHSVFFYLIILPALLLVLFLTTYPIGNVVYNSFFDYDFISGSREYIGLGNYRSIIAEELFHRSFQNTLIFTVSASVLEVLLGVALAFLLHRSFRGKRVASLVIIFPMIISTMVISAVWQTFYHFEIGLFNHLLRSVGLSPVGWLTDRSVALFSIVLVDIWQWTPFAFLIIQAGMSSIPAELYEAAEIDGAGSGQIAARITLPLLMGQIVLVLMLRTLDTFRLFDKVYALTGGGPANATQTLSFFIYREGFTFFNFGRAGAASVLTLVIVALLSLVYVRRLFREDA
jgi:multiple sugar transport system permease protein